MYSLQTWEQLIPDHVRKASPRRKVAKFLHSTGLNIAIIVLAAVDAMIVVAVLLLEIEALKLKEGPKYQLYEEAKFGLECTSLCIVSFFFIEILINVITVGPKHFFHEWIEVLDAIITTLSLIADAFVIADHVRQKAEEASDHHDTPSYQLGNGDLDTFGAAAGLLIIFRILRIVRVVNATMISIWTGYLHRMGRNKERFETLVHTIARLKAVLEEHKITLPDELQRDCTPIHEHHHHRQHHHFHGDRRDKVMYENNKETEPTLLHSHRSLQKSKSADSLQF
ncbi:unnamed protein product [Calicophoron daubneyi]|uniref:Voltage-gated hydrogen channel 1 n=1 Tax=Calicophoron daubneyi TaxID=300641 RepID=A0AAV2TYG4_CALDB